MVLPDIGVIPLSPSLLLSALSFPLPPSALSWYLWLLPCHPSLPLLLFRHQSLPINTRTGFNLNLYLVLASKNCSLCCSQINFAKIQCRVSLLFPLLAVSSDPVTGNKVKVIKSPFLSLEILSASHFAHTLFQGTGLTVTTVSYQHTTFHCVKPQNTLRDNMICGFQVTFRSAQ